MAAGATVTNNDFGDDRDPLLVRPFLMNDSGTVGDDPSTQTWPAATTREVRSQHASADDGPTAAFLPAAAPRRHRRHRRQFLVIGCVVVAVVLAAAAAGFAALRPGMRPSVSAALPGAPLPIVTGPAVAGSTRSAPSTAATSHRAKRSASAAATSRPTSTASTGDAGSGRRPGSAGQTATPSATPARRLAPAASLTGAIKGENGLCLDLDGGLTDDGTAVQIATCEDSDTQRWTVATDGTLQVAGKCALIVDDDTVHIASCDGRTTAQWRVVGFTLVNAANTECLTDPANGTSPGTAVTVTRCTTAANQQWSLP